MLVENFGLLLYVALEDFGRATRLPPSLTGLVDHATAEGCLVDRRNHAQHAPAEQLIVLVLVLVFDHLFRVYVKEDWVDVLTQTRQFGFLLLRHWLARP